tara:strand:+ start:1054 stop:1761 length:708 start_codon:yes stop_codon:yes gene_type:complete
MKRINIEQGTIEWHETRYRKIGGTKNKGLFVNSDTLLITLLGDFLEDFEDVDNFTSEAMQRGNDLEGPARNELNAYTGLQFNDAGWLQCEEIPLLGISPDGITDDDRFSAEIKCFGKDKHTRTIIEDIIPKDHINQCLHYFVINPKLEKHFFAAFRPENKLVPLFVKSMTRETVLDIGWTKKIEVEVLGKKGTPIKPKIVTVPDLKTVNEWVVIAKEKAKELQIDINSAIEGLKF